MSPSRLTPVDAQSFWLSSKIPNDTFLLCGFAGVPADVRVALDEVRTRASECEELRVRIEDGGGLRYPAWVPCGVDAAQVVRHDLGDPTWAGCQAAVASLFDDQLDATRRAWRLHVFPGVHGMPTVTGPGTVAVLQISHALGGGGRTSSSAALMFGREAAMPPVTPWRVGPFTLPLSGFRAAQGHRRLTADTAAGTVPPAAPPRPVLRTNARPTGARAIRTLTRPRAALASPTVTVAALTAISEALAGHLRALGDDPSTLGAEIMVAKPVPRRAYNHFGSAGIGLHPESEPHRRAELIAKDIADRRRRADHPAMQAADVAFAASPAPLLRWGTAKFDPDVRVPMVTGNTVVSSVRGGPADYAFGGAPVAFLAAYPGLSPMIGLTHCVCGVGDTVTVSVYAAESALGAFPEGLDAYAARLDAALG